MRQSDWNCAHSFLQTLSENVNVSQRLYVTIYMSQLVHENEERMFQSLSDAYLDKVVILVRSLLMGEAKVAIISQKITSGTM